MNPLEDLAGGIPSRITGLTAGLLRHLLSLGALAAEEGRLLVRQGVAALLLLVAATVVATISYTALVAAGAALLALKLGWGWPLALTSVGLLHLVILGILTMLLRSATPPRAFETTLSELRRDIDALGSHAEHSRRAP